MPMVKSLLEQNIGKLETDFTQAMLPAMETGVNSALGVLCLTEDISNNPMWSHYGSIYKGFAVQFKAQHEYFYASDKDKTITPIIYDEKPPKIDNLLDIANSDFDVIMEILFLNKSKEWEYEKEWRLIKIVANSIKAPKNDSNNNEVHLLSIPRDTITGIVFGLDFDLDEKSRIINRILSEENFSKVIPYDSVINRNDRRIEIKPIIY